MMALFKIVPCFFASYKTRKRKFRQIVFEISNSSRVASTLWYYTLQGYKIYSHRTLFYLPPSPPPARANVWLQHLNETKIGEKNLRENSAEREKSCRGRHHCGRAPHLPDLGRCVSPVSARLSLESAAPVFRTDPSRRRVWCGDSEDRDSSREGFRRDNRRRTRW